jgi:RimJ/RimL family protein N-acetyltransferase
MKKKPAKTVLTTERLILRTWQESDVPLMFAIDSDPVVMEHFPSTRNLAETQALVEHLNQQYEKSGYTLYATETRDTHEFIGFVGLNNITFEIPCLCSIKQPHIEIGWRLAAKFWDKGYATEAAKAVLNYGFTELNIPEIFAFTVVANAKSQRVMEKIGLHHSEEDDFDHPKLDKNSPLSRHVLYRLTDEEYLEMMNHI